MFVLRMPFGAALNGFAFLVMLSGFVTSAWAVPDLQNNFERRILTLSDDERNTAEALQQFIPYVMNSLGGPFGVTLDTPSAGRGRAFGRPGPDDGSDDGNSGIPVDDVIDGLRDYLRGADDNEDGLYSEDEILEETRDKYLEVDPNDTAGLGDKIRHTNPVGLLPPIGDAFNDFIDALDYILDDVLPDTVGMPLDIDALEDLLDELDLDGDGIVSPEELDRITDITDLSEQELQKLRDKLNDLREELEALQRLLEWLLGLFPELEGAFSAFGKLGGYLEI